MAWKKIFDYAQGDRRLVVEQDGGSGNVTVQANIVELPPDEAARMGVALSNAAFKFQKRSKP